MNWGPFITVLQVLIYNWINLLAFQFSLVVVLSQPWASHFKVLKIKHTYKMTKSDNFNTILLPLHIKHKMGT